MNYGISRNGQANSIGIFIFSSLFRRKKKNGDAEKRKKPFVGFLSVFFSLATNIVSIPIKLKLSQKVVAQWHQKGGEQQWG